MREAASGMPVKMMREDAMPACPAHQPLLSGPPSAALAQLVEHIIRNDGVTCSSHVSGTITPSASIHFRLKKWRKSAKNSLFLVRCVCRRPCLSVPHWGYREGV